MKIAAGSTPAIPHWSYEEVAPFLICFINP